MDIFNRGGLQRALAAFSGRNDSKAEALEASNLPGYINPNAPRDGIIDAPHSALMILEILDEILTQSVLKASDLYRCSQVCKRWNAPSLRVLWANSSLSLGDLKLVEDSGALAKHITLLKHLCIYHTDYDDFWAGDREAGHALANRLLVLHPNLRLVSLHLDLDEHSRNLYWLNRFLNTSMQRLELSSLTSDINPTELLDVVVAKSPFLEQVHFGVIEVGRYLDVDNFGKFISAMHNLRDVGIVEDNSGSVCFPLAQHQRLEVLTLYIHYNPTWVDEFVASTNAPESLFPCLKVFKLETDIQEAQCLRLVSEGILRFLQYLEVSCESNFAGRELFPALPSLPLLKHIAFDVRISGTSVGQAERLITPSIALHSFRSCQQLQHVSFYVSNLSPPYSMMTSEEICNMFAALPRARLLRLPWETVFGAKELYTLQTCCPQMESLILLVSSFLNYNEINKLRDPPVLPGIRFFCGLSSFEIYNWNRAVARLLRQSPEKPRISTRQKIKTIAKMFPRVVEHTEWAQYGAKRG